MRRPALFSMLLGAAVILASCAGYDVRVIESSTTQGLKGWEKPYTVNGRRYDPIRQWQGFTQNGIASWYGDKFHGKRTSNGEIYDMHAMTAAHKTLPLGVLVRVYNKTNGRSAVVRVNDRGPFVDERIIDLSYAAARTLGVDGPGTAPVRIEALGYPESSPASSGNVASAEGFTVQLGSFSSRENAQRLAQRVLSQGNPSEVREAQVDGRLYYRVHSGSFTTREQADAALQNLVRVGLAGGRVVALD